MSAADQLQWARMLASNPELKAAWEAFDRQAAEAMALMDGGTILPDEAARALVDSARAVLVAGSQGQDANELT